MILVLQSSVTCENSRSLVPSTFNTLNFKYIDKLQDIIKTYNNRKHRITKLSPNEGEKKENSLHIQNMQENYWRKIKPTKKIRFNVGDYVRIAISQPKFGRGYDKKSNEEIYKMLLIGHYLLFSICRDKFLAKKEIIVEEMEICSTKLKKVIIKCSITT